MPGFLPYEFEMAIMHKYFIRSQHITTGCTNLSLNILDRKELQPRQKEWQKFIFRHQARRLLGGRMRAFLSPENRLTRLAMRRTITIRQSDRELEMSVCRTCVLLYVY